MARNNSRLRTSHAVIAGSGILALSLLTACGGARSGATSGDDQQFTLKFSHVTTDSDPKGQAALKFEEVLEESTDGRIEVEIYPNSSLYGDEDELQALQSNAVQMLAPAGAKFISVAPELQVLDLPFLFDSVEAIPDVIAPDTAIGKAIYENENLAKRDIKVLGLWDSGLKQLTSNNKIETPADINGQSFRIQSSDVIQSQFKAWGGATTMMALSEAYGALQQGIVDGGENTYSNIESQKWHQVQKYITESNHGYIGYALVINDEFFNSLPGELQDAVVAAADEASSYNREIAAGINEESKEAILEEGGTQIIELSDAERRKFKEAVVPEVWNEYAGLVGQDLIDDLVSRQAD
jgi:C4-dicarboxylate-binding protein DctP